MTEHDPRCQGVDEQKLLDDVTQHGWHVLKIFEQSDSPGWAYSVGLYHTFRHPEIVVFGLNPDLMHSMINFIGDDVRSGKRFEDNKEYPDLIENYSCTFKTVNVVWYYPFLAYANWFYKGLDYPVLHVSGQTSNLSIRGKRISIPTGKGRNLCYFSTNRFRRGRLVCYGQ